jgi:hypothetical protein
MESVCLSALTQTKPPQAAAVSTQVERRIYLCYRVEDGYHRCSCSGTVLHGLCQLTGLGSVLFIDRSDQQGQQIAKRLDGGMHFAAFATLGSIIASTASAFRSRLQGPTLKNGCRRLPAASLGFAQEQAQIVYQSREAASCDPALKRVSFSFAPIASLSLFLLSTTIHLLPCPAPRQMERKATIGSSLEARTAG